MSVARRAVIALAAAGAWLTMACGSFTESAGPDGGADGGGTDAGATFRMFATTAQTNGNVGGLAGADNRCQTSAAAASLPGRYVALLVTTQSDPFAKLTEGQYVNTKGEVLFASTPRRGSVLQGKMLDEKGIATTANVWTGAAATPDTGGDCGGWTAKSGASGWFGSSDVPAAWFQSDKQACPTLSAIYCVEIP